MGLSMRCFVPRFNFSPFLFRPEIRPDPEPPWVKAAPGRIAHPNPNPTTGGQGLRGLPTTSDLSAGPGGWGALCGMLGMEQGQQLSLLQADPAYGVAMEL